MKNSDVAHVGSAVQGFAPPEKLLDVETWNGRALIEHQLRLLLQCEAAAQIDGTLPCREFGILVG